MAKQTQKEIIEQQTAAIIGLNARLLEAEVLIASMIDLIIDKDVLNRDELSAVIDQKISIINKRMNSDIKNSVNEKVESFPYFGQPGEA
jgi:hypothetical protein